MHCCGEVVRNHSHRQLRDLKVHEEGDEYDRRNKIQSMSSCV